MKKLLILILFFFTPGLVLASEVVTPEESIFEGVNFISRSKLENIAKKELENQGISNDVSITFRYIDKGLQLKNKSSKYLVEIENFDLNRLVNRFTANLSFKSDNGQVEYIDLYGRYDEVVEVPVITSSIPANTIIKEDDIDFIRIEKSKLKNDVITEISDIVGQTLKRRSSENQPIRARDIMKKQLVFRNNTINIIYETANMKLSSIGIALEDGAIGDVIKVRNPSSNKVIQAIVQNDKDAKVISSATM